MSTIKNAILTRYEGGYRSDTDATSISANGRRESFLSLSSTANSASTAASISAYLSLLDSGLPVVRTQLLPRTPQTTPYAGGWAVGCSITVPRPSNSNTGEAMYVRSMTVTEDNEGNLDFTPELQNFEATRLQRADQQLDQLNAGTLNGRSAAATIAGDLDPDVRAGRVRTIEQTFTKDTLEASVSPPWSPSEYVRLQSAFVQVKTRGTTSTTLTVRVNAVAQTFTLSGGATSSTITLPANTDNIFCMTTSHVRIQPTDVVSVEILTFGTSAAGLTVQLMFGEE